MKIQALGASHEIVIIRIIKENNFEGKKPRIGEDRRDLPDYKNLWKEAWWRVVLEDRRLFQLW